MSDGEIKTVIEQEPVTEPPPPKTRFTKCLNHFPPDYQSQLENFVIGDDISTKIEFREDLQILGNENEEEIGWVTINITAVDAEKTTFQVRSAAEATIGGQRCGSTSLSGVDRHFVTLHERRSEYANPIGESFNLPAKQSLYMVKEPSGYYVSVKQRHGDDEDHVDKEVSLIPEELVKHLLGEGANLLLLRYLAIIGYEGQFDAISVLLDGKPRITNYTASGLLKERYRGADALMQVIGRRIQVSRREEDTMTTVLATTGQEVRHLWHGWPYFYSLRPYQRIERSISPTQGVGVVTPLEICWENDMQMRSKYLDRKEERGAVHRSYFLDNAVIRNMISDFVQELLLFKPEDVLPFAIHHFSSYRFDYELEQLLGETHGPTRYEQGNSDDVLTLKDSKSG